MHHSYPWLRRFYYINVTITKAALFDTRDYGLSHIQSQEKSLQKLY